MVYLDGLVGPAVQVLVGGDQSTHPVVQPRHVLLLVLQLHRLQVPHLQRQTRSSAETLCGVTPLCKITFLNRGEVGDVLQNM